MGAHLLRDVVKPMMLRMIWQGLALEAKKTYLRRAWRKVSKVKLTEEEIARMVENEDDWM